MSTDATKEEEEEEHEGCSWGNLISFFFSHFISFYGDEGYALAGFLEIQLSQG